MNANTEQTTITIKAGPALTLGGGVLVLIGAVLPWVSARSIFGTINVAGIEGDGQLVIPLGVALVIGGWLQLRSEQRLRWPGVVAILTAAFIAIEILIVAYGVGEASNEYVSSSIGVGLYVAALGSAMAVYGAARRR